MTLGATYPPDGDDGAGEQLRWFQAAVAAAPRNASALNSLGVALIRRGPADKAIACLESAIELGPQLANPRVNLGNALKRTG
jgi:Flp pilus assembly protein TadD